MEGKRMPAVLLTRPEHQNDSLQADLEALGATVWIQPTIELKPPESWELVDEAIGGMLKPKPDFDWLVFSSANGVNFFFDRVRALQDAAATSSSTTNGVEQGFLKPVRIAVVGSGTDFAVQKRIGRRADVLPELFAAEGVLEHLTHDASKGKRFLLLRASRGRDVLKRTLTETGGVVTEIVVYRSVDVQEALPENIERMRRGEVDWTTVTSSAIARSLVRLFGDVLRQTRLVSISPITSDTLRELGFPPALEAKTASMDGIVDVLKKHWDA